MRLLLPLILVAIGVVVGFGFSELALVDRESRSTPSVPTEVIDPGVPTPASAGQGNPVSSSFSVSLSPAQDRAARLERALASLPRRPMPERVGSVFVFVATEDGEPVSGIEVNLYPIRQPAGVDPIDIVDDDLERYIRLRVEEQQYKRKLSVTKLSDSDGYCEFSDLPSGPYRVDPKTPGYRYEVRVEDRRTAVVVPGLEATVVLESSIDVPARVLLPDGSPSLTASILVSTPGGTTETVNWSASRPTLRLGPGRHELQARLGDGLESVSQSVALTFGAAPPSLIFLLEPPSGLEIVALAPELSVDVGLFLFWRESDAEELDRFLLAHDGSHGEVRLLAGRASHLVGNLVPGTYWVGAGYTRGRVDASKQVEITKGTRAVELELPLPDSLEHYRFLVLSGNGEPLSGVFIEFRLEGGAPERWERAGGRVRQYVDVDGAVVVLPSQDLQRFMKPESPRRLYARVTVHGLGTRTVLIESLDMVVRFAAPARLEVQVTGAVDGHTGGVGLFLRATAGGVDRKPLAPVRGKDSIFAATVEAGEYRLEGKLSDLFAVAPRVLQLLPGDQGIALEMPAAYQVSIRFPGTPPEQGDVMLNAFGFGLGVWAQIESGVATFDSVPPGEYLVSSLSQVMRVQVTGSQQIEFIPLEVNAMEVRILGTDLDEIHGLRDEDWVVGFDGEPFVGLDGLGLAYQALSAASSFVLNVARGGERLELEFSSDDFKSLQSHLREGRLILLPGQR